MVRSAAYRASKYDAKMVGDVVKNRIDAQRDSMVAQATLKFGDLVTVENAVKGLLAGWGVSTLLHSSYMAFGRKCYSIGQKHTGTVAVNEICYQHDLFVSRGLGSYYLQMIALAVADVDIGPCT